jgi:hypothetical protein
MRLTQPNPFTAVMLRDADSDYVPIPINERLVQCIWHDQRIQVDGLQTMDRRPVRVIFPGWWNLEAGPDFHHATIQVDDEPQRTGDVEIHLRADDWFHHGHDRDPLYNQVILHVVLWENGSCRQPLTRHGDPIPQVFLQNQLDTPLENLHDEIDLDSYPHNADRRTGRCSQILSGLSGNSLGSLLDSAGDERLGAKTRKFKRWIHHHGQDQAFYMGWMEALGYKANKHGFRSLARQLPLADLLDPARSPSQRAALLFGVANFLPLERPARGSEDPDITRRLWRDWWKLRPSFASRTLNQNQWRFTGVRPANHPHRRLAAAWVLVKKHPNLAERVLGSVESGGDPTTFYLNLRDEYWSHHFTLGGKAQEHPSELIGHARASEIVTNVVLPFAAAVGELQHNARLTSRVADLYRILKPASSNSLIRLACLHLFDEGRKPNLFLRTERRQQGLIQVFQDFCLNDKSGCESCLFPELAKRWQDREITGISPRPA